MRRGGWGGRARGAGAVTSRVRRPGGRRGEKLRGLLGLCGKECWRGVRSTFCLGVLFDIFSDLGLPA